jgi:hypothetical protein
LALHNPGRSHQTQAPLPFNLIESGDYHIAALAAVFSHDPVPGSVSGFSVSPEFKQALERLAKRLAGTNGLVGLYAPESTEPDYGPDRLTYGRVISLVRMLPMPAGHTVANYASGCIEFRRGQVQDRWPYGWPAETFFHSPHGGPILRDAWAFALKRHDFHTLTAQFHNAGPIDLTCGRLPLLSRQLMAMTRRRVAVEPKTQLRAF